MARFQALLLPFLAHLGGAIGQIFLANLTTSPPGYSTTCVEVLNQAVECSPLAQALDPTTFYDNATLTEICTATCTLGFQTYLRRAEGACPDTYFDGGDGFDYFAAYPAEVAYEAYSSICLTNSDGALCNLEIGSAAGIDPTLQRSTATPASSFFCNTCVLSALQTTLEMPIASNSEIASEFSAITSSCGATGFSVSTTAPTITWVTPATSTGSGSPAPTGCTGTTYTIQPGDTCNAVAASQGISTAQLLASNNLQAFCANFPASGSLCIPTAYTCTPYTIQPNDTCTTISAATPGVTWTQIVSFNPFLGTYCENIASYVGYVACTSNPGGSYVNPYPDSATTATTTSYNVFTLSMTPFSAGASPTIVSNITTTGAGSPPIASGTRFDCEVLITAPILANQTLNTTTLACADVAAAYNVSLADFQSWNPSLSTSSDCAMTAGTQYCAQLVQQVAPGVTTSCVQFATAPPGWTCANFTDSFAIEQDYFGDWNPGVGSSCNNWQTGVQYCIAVRGFRQAGIISTCNLFAQANDTNWLDLPCQIIETEFGLSHARFVAWNPAVLDNCTGIVENYDYCVSIPNYHPTFTSTLPITTWVQTNPFFSATTTWPDPTASGTAAAELAAIKGPVTLAAGAKNTTVSSTTILASSGVESLAVTTSST